MSALWTGGQVIPDTELRISALDRTFEHGLGLFETFRTWRGHPTLLDRHLDRLQRSARSLGLPLADVVLPTAHDVEALRRDVPHVGDHRLRIVLTGGRDSSQGATLWMRAQPLPPPLPTAPAIVCDGIPLWEGNPLLHHKTLNYWSRQLAHKQTVAQGADEVLTYTAEDDDVFLWEGSRTNLFVVRDDLLVTPPLDAPILPGIMRAVVLDGAKKLGINTMEGPIPRGSIERVSEAFLTNSARGIWPISELLGHSLPAPGPLTSALWRAILPWLESGGDAS
jgi:branched-chain amino acid aminotransferase